MSAIMKLLLVTLAVSLILLNSSEARPADDAVEADVKTTEKPDSASSTSVVSTTGSGDVLDATTTAAPAEGDSETSTSEPVKPEKKEVQ